MGELMLWVNPDNDVKSWFVICCFAAVCVSMLLCWLTSLGSQSLERKKPMQAEAVERKSKGFLGLAIIITCLMMAFIFGAHLMVKG